MTVASATSRIEYSTTSGLLTYAYPFRIFAETDLQVYKATTLLTLNTHYTVTGAGDANGGNVVLATNPGASVLLALERVLPLTQGHDYVENDRFPAESHETALDRSMMIDQQLYQRDRKRPAFLPGSATQDWTFPDPVSYSADGIAKYIRMNAAHTALEAVSGAADVSGVLDDVIPSVAYASLPAAATGGRLRRVTDRDRGLYVDTGSAWYAVASEIANVEAFGAKGDGVTDDRQAIIDALAAIPAGGILHFPAGTYVISDTITNGLQSGVTLRGAGMGVTILSFTKALADSAPDLGEGGYALFKQTTAVSRVRFEDLSFTSTTTEVKMKAQGNGNVRGHSAVYIVSGDDLLCRRVEVSNWGGRAIYIGGTGTVSQRLRFESCYAHDTWSDAFVGVNVTNLSFVGNVGRNIHPADTDGDGVYNSQFADFCHASSSREVHYLGNSAENVCRIAYLSEGTAAIPGENLLLSNNYASGVGWGCPSGSGAAVWLENTTGRLVCSDFLFEDVELGINIALENSHRVHSAHLANGLIRIANHAKTSGKSDSLYGGILSKARVLHVAQVNFELNGTGSTDNGYHCLYLLEESEVCITACTFRANVSRSPIVLDFGSAALNLLAIQQCHFVGGTSRLITTAGSAAADLIDLFIFDHNHIRPNTYSGAGNYLIDLGQDVANRVQFTHNVFNATGDIGGIANFQSRFIVCVGNVTETTHASTVAHYRLARFQTALIAGNVCHGVTTGEKLIINGGALYGIRAVAIVDNAFFGASPDHLDISNTTHTVIRGNSSADATTRAYTLQATAADALVEGNHADESTLTAPQADTILGRNWVAGAPVPALPQTATIPNGATSVTVTHGLSYTPSAADIVVIPTNSPPNALTTGVYVNTITATQFNINRNDPGGDATFSWQVVR